ncbi:MULTISPECIES: hypothetical protein [unclassified Cryobacterium]|uniref:hypothetical protein n=1 Tax=unclassified Cryobacterium TaxID=2649013 RepID=UPI002AB59964|nr:MULTISPECIES: hypothetical protein [unclassified Cryobacterium]MDY7542608.1 hypothetical protein [Cryobacterium sp. 5B3]MEB0264728.1 hypothetical protein [Cryobacterium sp. 10I5]MEB0273700.1 hypothetical protein [Cryobacterium sp. 5B3]
MWEAIAAIGVPIVTGLIAFFTSALGAGRERRLREHLELAELAKDNPQARGALDELVEYEASIVLRLGKQLADRKLNVPNLFLSIFLALMTAGVLYALFSWLGTIWGESAAWLPIGLIATAGLFLVLLTAAGFSMLFKPSKPKNTEAVLSGEASAVGE